MAAWREEKNENSELNPKENLGPLLYYLASAPFFPQFYLNGYNLRSWDWSAANKKKRIGKNHGDERRCSQAVKRFRFLIGMQAVVN